MNEAKSAEPSRPATQPGKADSGAAQVQQSGEPKTVEKSTDKGTEKNKVHEQKTSAPSNEDRTSVDSSKVDKPVASKTKSQKPKTEKPRAEKTKQDKAKAQKPNADKPDVDKAKAQKPGADKPDADKAKAQKPGADKPDADKPKSEKPAADKQPASNENRPATSAIDD